MNSRLHAARELKATGSGNPFVIFGEPDIDILHDDDGRGTLFYVACTRARDSLMVMAVKPARVSCSGI